jgi:hypothetical protein
VAKIASKSNIKIVANHLINDPILSVIQANGKTPLPRAVWDKIGIIRDVVFDAITNISPANYSFIFTNELIMSGYFQQPIHFSKVIQLSEPDRRKA